MIADTPSNADVAAAFALLGDLLEIDGASRHRVLAYRRATERILELDRSFAQLALDSRAVDLPDIGATIQAKTVEFVETGDIAALAKLRRVGFVVVDPANRTGGAAAEIAALVAEEAFDCLKKPIVRVATPDVPIPFSPALEKPLYPSREGIAAAVKKLL